MKEYRLSVINSYTGLKNSYSVEVKYHNTKMREFKTPIENITIKLSTSEKDIKVRGDRYIEGEVEIFIEPHNQVGLLKVIHETIGDMVVVIEASKKAGLI